jgi:hypothetical protein
MVFQKVKLGAFAMMLRCACLSICLVLCRGIVASESYTGGVGDPQLMTDHPFYKGELSCSTFERLFATQAGQYSRITGRKADNDEDKAIASWFWRGTHYVHCSLLGEPDVFAVGKPEVVREYWAGLFSYGHGMCQETHYQYTAEMEELLGHCHSRAVGLEGHTSFEVFVAGADYGKGKWVLLDQDINTVCFDKEQKLMMNIEEIKKTPRGEYTTRRAAKDNRGWLPELCAGDGGLYYSGTKFDAPLSGYSGAPPMVNLRPGESLRRFPRPGLGAGPNGTLVYWGNSLDGMKGPNRHTAYTNDPTNFFNATARPRSEPDPAKRARYGNAVFTYTPNFEDDSYKAGVAAEDNSSVIFEHNSPFVIAAKPIQKCNQPGCTLGLVIKGKASCKVSISTDAMKTFSEPVDLTDGLDLTDLVKGHYQYWLKFGAPAKDLAGKEISVMTCCMANGYVMPQLKGDGAQVTFNASGLAVETIGPQADAIAKNIVDGAMNKDNFTVKMKTPHGEKIKTVCWAVRSPTGCPPKPDLAFKAEYSADGKTWKVLRENWHVNPPDPYKPPDTWSQSFFYGTKDIGDEGLSEVLVKVSNNLGKTYQMGQFSLTYETPNTGSTKVTYCWEEDGKQKTAEHGYAPGAKMDSSWKIDTGKDPKLLWVEMTATK